LTEKKAYFCKSNAMLELRGKRTPCFNFQAVSSLMQTEREYSLLIGLT